MHKRAGTFIAIEGTDGSGKGTQFTLLCDRLRQAGYDIATFDFPQYASPSSYFVKQYLNGEYGNLDEVGPYTASLFYALDRYEAAPQIREALAAGKVVVSNRFTGSSMGHQGTKFRSPEERRGYFIWLDNLEFEMLGVPRPDISFILRVPAEVAHELIEKKTPRTYTDKKRDLHESDLSHLEKSIEVYDDLAQLFPKDFQRIDCVRSGKLLGVDTVQNMLWEKIAPLLPPPRQLELTTKDIPSPAAAAVGSGHSISEPAPSATAAPEKPGQNAQASAPAAKEEPRVGASTAEPETAHATSTRPRPVSGFREVIAQHFVLEGSSQLLAQAIEGSRFAAYVGEPDAAQDYTQKTPAGKYRYHTPEALTAATAERYRAYMDKLFELHGTIAEAVAKYLVEASDSPAKEKSSDAWRTGIRAQALLAAQPVLPVAATAKVVVLAFGHALEDLVTELLSSELPELHTAGETLLKEARQLSPTFLQDADKPSAASPVMYRTATTAAVASLAKAYLPDQHAGETTGVKLTEASPRNELDIITDILYTHSNLPLQQLRNELGTWPYNRKLDLFEAYVGERTTSRQLPGNALENIRYRWDIVSDYNAFRELQRQQAVGGAVTQELTPRYGYSMPAIIEKAGAADLLEECFDLSLQLYSFLQQAGHPLEAQYATLQGHRLRWKLSHTAYDAIRLLERPAKPATRELKRQMHDALNEAHPLIGEIVTKPAE
jgi:dTMP kinase